jgi:subtilase family serine protease
MALRKLMVQFCFALMTSMTLMSPVAASLILSGMVQVCSAQVAPDSAPKKVDLDRINEMAEIDSAPRVSLVGNLRPEAGLENDLGAVAGSLHLEHILLQLQRSPSREAALDRWLDGLNDKSSPNYHRWITAEEFGNLYGVSARDLDTITDWLELHGFSVNTVYPSRMLVDFSGTASQVREAFETEIHTYSVDGIRHLANASNPSIPSPLAPLIAGIVSLHDFRPHSLLESRPRRQFTEGSGSTASYLVTPADLAIIYNIMPLFKAGYTGKGQVIAVIEDSDMHSVNDWAAFREAFGLTAYTTGSLRQIHPMPVRGTNNCADPGARTGWDEEPSLDAEYASAAAPGATIEVASCESTGVTNGNLIALANLVNSVGQVEGNAPSVISVSYGNCEAANGAGANAAINSAYQQAAAEGISVFAASGDGGAAFCDVGATVADHGVGVNAYASTPYNVAVGGTDFSDVFAGTTSLYWNKNNSATGGSAKSYIPETPWNDSCANPLIAAWNGFKSTYGLFGFCTYDYLTTDAYQTTVAGSGGPSGCATGGPLFSFTVSGTCHGYAKPAWQSVIGNSVDHVRDLPDLALFAADGIWGHAFVFCDSNLQDDDGAVCKSGDAAMWSQGGGTSFAAPILAGLQALVDQKWGRQGNPNPVYYKLAAAQFTSPALKSGCNSALGAETASGCIFHDVTQGASTVNCQGIFNCFGSVLSTNLLIYAPAYDGLAGWDFSTGLGSVNAYNLVMNPAW